MKALPKLKRHHLIEWLPLAFVITILCLFGYVAQQQTIRSQANQPQTALAREVSDQLSRGMDPHGLMGSNVFDLAKSEMPFLIVYDDKHQPITGNGVIDGDLPAFPAGALDYAKTNGENRVTWQPTPNIRIASVVRPYSQNGVGGFVVAGQSLEEPEKMVDKLGVIVLTGWLVALLGSLGLIVIKDVLK